MSIFFPSCFVQSKGAFISAHSHLLPSSSGLGAEPPPWGTDGAEQPFQSSF